jgi:hypothetical protein
MSASDAVGGSFVGHGSAIDVGAVGAHEDASDYDDRSRHHQVGFQVHGIDAARNVIVSKQLKRRYVLAFFQRLEPCLRIEAFASPQSTSKALPALVAAIVMAMERVTRLWSKKICCAISRDRASEVAELERADLERRQPSESTVLRR